MSRILLLVIAAFGAPWSAVAQNPSQAERDYNTGLMVGSCMAGKCLVFQGDLPIDTPKAGAPVAIRVRGWLYGQPAEGPTFAVPYDDPAAPGASPTAQAWRGVNIAAGGRVTVVFALKRAGFALPDAPAVVASSDHDDQVIRSLLVSAARLDANPETAEAEVASLSDGKDAALAGFLFTYIWWSDRFKGDVAADLLAQIFANPSVPPEDWASMPWWVEFLSTFRTPEKRRALVGLYLDLAQQDDARAVRAGLAGLAIVLGGAEADILVPAEARSKIAKIYRSWVQRGAIPRDDQLEKALGVR